MKYLLLILALASATSWAASSSSAPAKKQTVTNDGKYKIEYLSTGVIVEELSTSDKARARIKELSDACRVLGFIGECKFKMHQPPILVDTVFISSSSKSSKVASSKATSARSSAAVAAPITIQWVLATKRQNGTVLARGEIYGHQVVKTPADGSAPTKVNVPLGAKEVDPITYTTPFVVTPGDILNVYTIDTAGTVSTTPLAIKHQ